MLSKFALFFNGELKKYSGKKIHLDVRPDAKPVRYIKESFHWQKVKSNFSKLNYII
jgi:hypothetical protein